MNDLRIPTNINVNVVFSGKVTFALDGHAIVEILSTASTDAASLAKVAALTAGLKDTTDTLSKAESDNPIPTP